MNLADRFYTSTEVAEILGVSLRSVYRYLEEGTLDAEVKTATGRHRFTKQNILDFLYPDSTQSTQRSAGKAYEEEYDDAPFTSDEVTPVDTPVVEETTPESEEEIDWLAKFRTAAEKYREAREKEPESSTATETGSKDVQVAEDTNQAEENKENKEFLSSLAEEQPQAKTVEETEVSEAYDQKQVFYYKSKVGGLKELAQYINSSARKSNVPYAFTMNAGLSLHKLIRPFSILHIYVRPEDKDFFERALELTPTDQNSAQLGLFIGKRAFDEVKEIHGLRVVSDAQLRKDLLDAGEFDLASELDEAVNA